MIDQRKIRIGGIAIILLVILNIGMMIFLLTQNQEGFRPPGPELLRKKDQSARTFIIRELAFTPEQVVVFDSLRISHRQSTKEINQTNQKLRRQYFDQLMENVPASETEYLAEEIGTNQTRLEKILYRHFEDIREICTPQQREKFDSLIKEIFKMIMPPPMPGPGHPPPAP
ncbi:MAG: hypothetical protein KDD99_23530 [Bacteroidetes bacterium]|nr:hypothetical protein [Bacteroidota bacterium]